MRTLPALFVSALVVFSAGLVAPGQGLGQEQGLGQGETFSFEKVNGVYSNPNPDLEPIQQGPLTVQLRSPANRVELRENRLLLTPNADGTHSAWLTLELQGEGDLEADLMVGGMTSKMTDKVSLPPQTLLLEGKIELRRQDSGYLVTGVELQPEVRLEIRSQLAKGLVTTCSRFSLLVPLGVGCKELERSLSMATVPMPEAGTTFLLSDELLTDSDRKQLDAYLERSQGS